MKTLKPSAVFATAITLLLTVGAWAIPTTKLINNFEIIYGNLAFRTGGRSPQTPLQIIQPLALTTSEINDVYTLPDLQAPAYFVLSTTAQTQAGGAAIGPGQVAPSLVQHATIPLTAANLIAMYAAPVNLIPAGATGTNIQVNKVQFTMTTTSTAFTGGGVLEFQIGNTVHGAGTATTATVAAAVVTAAAGTSYTTVIPVSYTGTSATGLYISNQTAAFAAGTGTAVVDIWYTIQ